MKENSSLTYKEIYGQPESFKGINDTLDEIYKVLDKAFDKSNQYDELIFTGCGTSFYLAQSAAHAFSTYTGISARAVPCSELYFFPETFVEGKKVLVLPITRKSYTTEVRMAIDKVRSFPDVQSLAITCDPDSKTYNDYVILSPVSSEDSVIMTRSFTSMVYLAMIMAMYVAGKNDEIKVMADYDRKAQEILPKMDEMAKKIIEENPDLNLFITLGQGVYYGIANECMNKMKEMGIVNSEAYYSLEYRHGPMSLVDENTMVLTLVNSKSTEHDAKLLSQMKGFGAVTAAVGKDVSKSMNDVDYTLDLTYDYNDMQYAPMIGFIGQLLGYYIAEKKNIDADSPRNLSQAIVL